MTGGTTTRRAAPSLGGIVAAPPIGRADAGRIIGREISAGAWARIEAAFSDHGDALDALAASKASRKKDDPQGWHARRALALKAIEAAMHAADRARRAREFLDECSEAYSVQTGRGSAGPETDAARLLDEAFARLMGAAVIIERAAPMHIDVPTAAAARDLLARAVAEALTADGIAAETSSGWRLDDIDNVRLADLTDFERLMGDLGIGDEKKPAAYSAWLRGALSGGSRG